MAILITGGLGYIGSHLTKALINQGKDVIIIDDLSNSFLNEAFGSVPIYIDSLLNEKKLMEIFEKHRIETVIHMAGFKSVKESVLNPLRYYDNNLIGTIVLLKVMKRFNVENIIFSSSATVYKPSSHPLKEEDPVDPQTPYGRTKKMIEDMILDVIKNVIILRYFNPMGCDSELIEVPKNVPENLAPYIIKVLRKEIPFLTVFGDDYDTPDGTCIRDYIHIDDLVEGHALALGLSGKHIINLGTGQGYSVLEILEEFENHGFAVPYIIGPRRKGDLNMVCASTVKAKEVLGWSAKKELTDMVESIIRSI